MRIVNWNVERAAFRSPKNHDRVTHILSLQPDLVVLTETNRRVDLGDEFSAFFTEPSPRKPRRGEAVAALWARKATFPRAELISTHDPREAVCARIESDSCKLLVYASIIPYHAYPGTDGTSKLWREHRNAIEWHKDDWIRLRERYPRYHFVAAGDYNQCRDGVGRYGTVEVRRLLSNALSDAGMTCVTENDFVASHALSRRNIDHACVTDGLVDALMAGEPFEGTIAGRRLSDHNGISVDFDLANAE